MRRDRASSDPNRAQSAWEESCRATAPLQQHTYRCGLLTPLLGGGVQAGRVDPLMPIRVAGIRGQLRFWWRISRADQDAPSSEVFQCERRIWGGIGDTEPTASQVRIRVSAEAVQRSALRSEGDIPGGAMKYAFGPGVIDGVTWLPAGYGFNLQLTYPETLADDVQTALRWWASFGGIGARTRRGLGAVSVNGIEPIDDQAVRGRGGQLHCRNQSFDSAERAWTDAVTKLHQFRQGPEIGRRPARAENPRRPARSFWPEPDQLRRFSGRNDNGNHRPVHEAGNVFPRAAFGMPIQFEFHKSSEPDTRDLLPDRLDGEHRPARRMASPLILRPYHDADRWRAGALLLPGWRDAMTTPLRFNRDEETPEHWPGDETAEDRSERQRLAGLIPPMAGRGDDPLSAFMAFFMEP